MNFTQRLTEVRLVRDAYLFASAAHFAVGQKRKFSGEDYIVHPVDVAKIVHGVKNSTDTMVAAALLHDTVEDTQVTTSVIQSYFGAEVADLVEWLTNVTTLEDGNRKTRKKLDRERMWKAPYEAQTIKVADVIANLSDIERQDESFSKVYFPEKKLLLAGMNADETLLKRAKEIISNYEGRNVKR